MKNAFNKNKYAWKKNINYRISPDKYKVGKGEQGVLICEPYKSEILPFWKFKTPKLANESAGIIFNLFKNYLKHQDFIGADMARKFLQMGYTRSRRYANYQSGKKYNHKRELLKKGTGDPKKFILQMFFFMLGEKQRITKNIRN